MEGQPESLGIDEFVRDRTEQVRSGQLIAFAERETAHVTERFGHVAHRFSTYSKRSEHAAAVLASDGIISTQFVNTPAGWLISAMAWDDERPGLTIPSRYRRPLDGGHREPTRPEPHHTLHVQDPTKGNDMSTELLAPAHRPEADTHSEYICPACDEIGEVEWRDWSGSTSGPVEHVKIRCANRHWFLMLAESLNTRLER